MFKLSKEYFKELIRLQTNPKDIARGVALGVFIGFIPIWGLLQLIVALFFGAILRVNKIAIIVGTMVTNPITIPFIYALCFKAGKWLLKSEVQLFALKDLTTANIVAVAKPILLGSIFVGLIAAVLSYIIAYYITWYFYKKKKSQFVEMKEIP